MCDENTTRLLNIDSTRMHYRSTSLNQMNQILDSKGKLHVETDTAFQYSGSNKLHPSDTKSPSTEIVKIKSPSMKSINHQSPLSISDADTFKADRDYHTEIPQRIDMLKKNNSAVSIPRYYRETLKSVHLRRKSAELKPSKSFKVKTKRTKSHGMANQRKNSTFRHQIIQNYPQNYQE